MSNSEMAITDHGSYLKEWKVTKKPKNWTVVNRLS